MIWFWGCTHFGHANIMRFCPKTRPFDNVNEMNEWLLDQINSNIREKDTFYHLGDLAFYHDREKVERLLSRINCKKMILIKGNHDRTKLIDGLIEHHDYLEVKYAKKRLVLCHYPIECWNGKYKGSYMLHSHVHNNMGHNPDILRFDVGVDCVGRWGPVNIESIIQNSFPRIPRSNS